VSFLRQRHAHDVASAAGASGYSLARALAGGYDMTARPLTNPSATSDAKLGQKIVAGVAARRGGAMVSDRPRRQAGPPDDK